MRKNKGGKPRAVRSNLKPGRKKVKDPEIRQAVSDLGSMRVADDKRRGRGKRKELLEGGG